MLVNTQVSLQQFVQTIRDFLNGQALTIRLFQNDHVPADTDTLADYVAATFTGYVPLNIIDWSGGTWDPSGAAFITAPTKNFNQTGTAITNTIFGYYVISGGGTLMFAERNPAGGVPMNQAGYTYAVVPRWQLRNQTGSAVMGASVQGRADEVTEHRADELPPHPAAPGPAPTRPSSSSAPAPAPAGGQGGHRRRAP